MSHEAKQILFSIDLEEFDIPEEYGLTLPTAEKLEVSLKGMQHLEALMAKYNVSATLFTTAYLASCYPDYTRHLSTTHEIASHTYYHDRFEITDLATSKNKLEDIIGNSVYGIRMPRMNMVDINAIKAAGYLYDSSVNPTYIPGRYNNLNKPRTLYNDSGIWELPASVTPVCRIPLFWLTFKNIPFSYYLYLCRQVLERDGYVVLYAHPWEFTDLSKYKLPAIVKRTDGERLLNKLDRLFVALAKEAVFATHYSYIQSKEKAL
ncbi:hypothetical protein CAP35_10810 [Chitinophagaceae bacterium IBVUCB1]|nr:hypothetical protein CAP35_10810 [Chitinophagaceae bacterium IBVUCB1]